jgi:predicted  nucleic acid-binding Zn-ribbon protein
MARNKELAELARSLHRAAERLWMRVTDPGDYEATKTDIEQLQKSNTQLNRAITKLKRKVKR